MTNSIHVSLALGLILALTACSAPRSDNSLAAPPAGAETAPPPAAGGSAAAPVLAVPSSSELGIEGAAPADDGKADAIIVLAPDGSQWKAPSGDRRQQRADAESCYTYAQAATRRETRLTDDRDAASDNLNTHERYSFFRNTVRDYDSKRRLGSLMESCMSGKGYLQL